MGRPTSAYCIFFKRVIHKCASCSEILLAVFFFVTLQLRLRSICPHPFILNRSALQLKYGLLLASFLSQIPKVYPCDELRVQPGDEPRVDLDATALKPFVISCESYPFHFLYLELQTVETDDNFKCFIYETSQNNSMIKSLYVCFLVQLCLFIYLFLVGPIVLICCIR